MTGGLAPRSLDLWPDAALIADADGVLLEANDALARMFGYDRDTLIGAPVELLLPEHLATLHRAHRGAFAQAPARRPMGAGRPLAGRRADGTTLRVDVSLSPIVSDVGPLVIATVRESVPPPPTNQPDVPTDATFRSVFDDSPLGMATVDASGHITAANRALLELVDATVDDLVGRAIEDLGTADPELGELPDAGTAQARRFVHRDGATRWGLVDTAPLREPRRGAESIVVVQDVTDTMTERHRLAHLATHDELTGLPTRVLLWERLERALARADRTGDAVAVLYLDLDRFKAVNDTLGHRAGDAVLREVARRLQSEVRPSDTAARVGGDEFVVCCDGLPARPVVAWGLVQGLVSRLRVALDAPITIDAVDTGGAAATLTIGVSIGAAIGVGAARSADTLVWEADAAMFREKASHRRQVDPDPRRPRP